MSIVKYEPNSFVNKMKNDMEKMLSTFERWPHFFGDEEEDLVSSQWSPAVDLKEEDKRFVVRADIPGVDPKDIEVSMENGYITIKGEREKEDKEEKKGYKRIERFHGAFYRRFSLPDTADSESVKAKNKHGVLEIAIGKKEGSEPRKISVQS